MHQMVNWVPINAPRRAYYFRFCTKAKALASNLDNIAKGPVNTFHGPMGDSCITYKVHLGKLS